MIRTAKAHERELKEIAAATVFVNLTGAFFAFGPDSSLKDTGRKLAHFDRELNAGHTPIAPHLHREELN